VFTEEFVLVVAEVLDHGVVDEGEPAASVERVNRFVDGIDDARVPLQFLLSILPVGDIPRVHDQAAYIGIVLEVTSECFDDDPRSVRVLEPKLQFGLVPRDLQSLPELLFGLVIIVWMDIIETRLTDKRLLVVSEDVRHRWGEILQRAVRFDDHVDVFRFLEQRGVPAEFLSSFSLLGDILDNSGKSLQ